MQIHMAIVMKTTKKETNNGLARIATYVEEERKQGPIVLIDDGDTYQGTIMSDAIYNKKKRRNSSYVKSS